MIDKCSKKHKILGLGCSTFGGSKSKRTALRTLHNAYDLGINYFDVARSYGYGQAEAIVGEFIKGKRDKVILTSKFGICPPKPFPLMTQVKDMVRIVKKIAPGISQQVIKNYSSNRVSRPVITPVSAMLALEKSLSELRTDYLDYYLLHDCPFDSAVAQDVCSALEKAKDKGMIRAWGATCENHSELYKYFQSDSPFNVVQFPYQPENYYVGPNIDQRISKVLFSVMSQSAGQTEPPSSFFRKLAINKKAPGVVQNLREAWLYIASRELDSGVVLCSMTQKSHLKRNLAILNAPDITEGSLQEMKRMMRQGVESPAVVEWLDSQLVG